MRVLFAIGSMGGGGAEQQVIHFLRHLDRKRFQPVLYLTLRQGECLAQVPDDVSVHAFEERIRQPRLYVPGHMHRLQSKDLAQFVDEEKIDVVVAVTFYLALVAGSKLGRGRCPWMAVEMADPRLDFPLQTTRFRWLKKRLLRHAYHRANRCVAVSNGVRDGLQQCYGLTRQQVSVVPNFIDQAEVDRLAKLPGPTLAGDRFHIATMGRLHSQKGHRYLLEALHELVVRAGITHLHLHLLGQGPLEGELRRRVHQLQLQDHVTFAGYLANPFPYLRCCQLFCLPSLFEGLPLALLEAMNCGLPVVASDCPSGPAEILDAGRLGRLVPPADSRALADAIQDCIANYSRCCERVPAARQRIASDYSTQAVLPRFEQLLRDLGRGRS
jgi:glycosyltransferase involved in cell wall biosynthesis